MAGKEILSYSQKQSTHTRLRPGQAVLEHGVEEEGMRGVVLGQTFQRVSTCFRKVTRTRNLGSHLC